ncbi:hypothetical protein VMCG_02138 [Cytospora schulzeri]|uniref:C2H2-type domain-containing protein n=1 Tax=Cytospora schulzeri TaxID=448051 RepID=A0A423X3A0_9PEZI|nr:hypothetical protein VMCG_02138 [Valsa malicola]
MSSIHFNLGNEFNEPLSMDQNGRASSPTAVIAAHSEAPVQDWEKCSYLPPTRRIQSHIAQHNYRKAHGLPDTVVLESQTPNQDREHFVDFGERQTRENLVDDKESDELPWKGAEKGGYDGPLAILACPLFKHNPTEEHLYRRHLLPKFRCIRCSQTFQTSEHLSEHSRAEVYCKVVQDDDTDQEGITQDQLTQLKSRKRGRDVESDHDKWIRIYKILFPEDYLIPSPSHTGREAARLIQPKLEDFLNDTSRKNLTTQSLEELFRDIFTNVLDTSPTTQAKAQTKSNPGDAQSLDRDPAPATTQASQEPPLPMLARHPPMHLPGSESLHNPSPSWEVPPHQASTSAPPSLGRSSQAAYGGCNPDSLLLQQQLGAHAEAGPSNTQQQVEVDSMGCGFPPSGYTTTTDTLLKLTTDLFPIPIQDLHGESTAWFVQPETSTNADAGSFHSQSTGWDLFAGF